MEASMVRRSGRPCLQVRETFEATRLGRQFLIEAYARLVPVRRRAVHRVGKASPQRRVTGLARKRGGEHA
jgi:hypothetical protein